MRLQPLSELKVRFIFLAIALGVIPLLAQHGPAEADLSAKQLQPAAGLKVETFASDPLFVNPVAFSIDEKGRFFIAETHRYKDAIFDLWKMDERWRLADFSWQTVADREKFLAREFATNLTFLTQDSEIIRLVEDKDGDGFADASAIFADGFNQITSGTAAGILARQGEVWFTCIPDLWKFQYGGDGKMARREILSTGYGVHISVSGHDMHGLALGPDGKLYFSVGDRGANVKSKEGKQLESLQRGSVFRCNSDGSELEIFATGMRNPQELAFDELGNLWAHDNDTSGEDQSRILYVVEGGDYGWRQSYQFMEEFGPWVLENVWQGNIDDVLPPAGYGAQGPSGLAAYPGVGLPEKYKGSLLGCDFPQGVWAYFPQAKGAGYWCEKEKFLWGFGATDVDFGPDGQVYISDWGKSYNMPNAGRIYRVFDPTQKTSSHLREVPKLLGEGMKQRGVPELVTLLGHEDLRVRTEAQFALTAPSQKSQEVIQAVKPLALAGSNRLARIHAIRVLGGVGGKSAVLLAEEILLSLLGDADAEIRGQAVVALSGRIRNGQRLLPLLADASARVRFHAAMLLGRLQKKEAVAPLWKMLQENADQDPYLVHAGVWALASIDDFTAIQAAAQNENASIRRAAMLTMRRMKRPEIAQFLQDTEPRLAVEAARAINDVPIPAALPELAALLDDCKCSAPMELRTQFIARAINANFRLGQPENFTRLVNFLVHPKAPESMRVTALRALSDWEKPSPLDRVVGLWRPLSEHRLQKLPAAALLPILETLAADNSVKTASAAVQCARQLGLSGLSPVLFALLQKEATTNSLRVEILATLGELKAPQFSRAVAWSLASRETALRAAAVKWTAKLNPAEAAPLLEKLLATEKDLTIGRAVLRTLGELKNAAANAILRCQLEEMRAKKLPPELQLDLLEAAAQQTEPLLQSAWQKYEADLAPGDELASFRPCLHGGDVEAGKKIFRENDAVGCLRCHAIKGKGGNVGPDLAGIAARFSREQLLEAVLFPNHQIAPGFENVTIILPGGISHAGMVKSETERELVLNSPEDGVLTLKKSDIVKRDRALSAMPEGLSQLLSKQDLRNLLEYLATLK